MRAGANTKSPFTREGSTHGETSDSLVQEYRDGGERSSAGERILHTDDVAGSIPAAPTIGFPDTTTHRGDVAEMLAAAELLRRGYRVCRPLSNGSPYDLIVDDGASLHRIQVKRAYPVRGGFIAKLCTSKAHRGRPSVLYRNTCEAVVVVDCDAVRFYVFAGKDLESPELLIRSEPTRNGQMAGVRLATGYDLSRLYPAIAGGAL